MNAIHQNQGLTASTSSLGFNHAQAPSSTGSRVFENDQYRFSTQGTNDVTLQNKHSGDTHQASGDFGQSQLDGRCHDHQGQGNGAIDKIVQKVIEAVCKALGIDPSEVLGQQPAQGQQPTQEVQFPHDGCKAKNPDSTGECMSPHDTFGPPQYARPAVQDDRPVSPLPNPLGLGSAQNQRDHNPIELALDPLGFF